MPLIRPVPPLAPVASLAERCAIAVMAKASHAGRTKTRLSPPLTLEQAADLNTVFLRDIADNLALAAQAAPIDAFMAFGPPGATAFFEQHLDQRVGLLEAWLPSFGDCLLHTVETLLGLGYGAACVLNSDSPTLPTALLIETARVLLAPGERVALGPSTDGGYYLLGLKRPHRRLFADITWSSERVCAETQARAAELELDTALLAPWYDVDDAASLQLLLGETLGGRAFCPTHRSYPAPHTAAFLEHSATAGWLPAARSA